MPDELVLDSSVIAAHVLQRGCVTAGASQWALNVVTAPDLVTLDLAVAEVGNVAWKRVVMSGQDKGLT